MASRKNPPAEPPAGEAEKPIRLNDLIPRQTVFGGRRAGQRTPEQKDKDKGRTR